MRNKMLILSLLIVLIGGKLNAQTKDHPWNVGGHFGKTEWIGDAGSGLFNLDKAFYMHGGLSLSHYVSPSIDVSLIAKGGEVGYWSTGGQNVQWVVGKAYWKGNFYGDQYQGMLAVKYKFNNGYFLKEKSRIQPYAFIGIGASALRGGRVYFQYEGQNYKNNPTKDIWDVSSMFYDMIIPVGVGVNVRITDRWNAYVQTTIAFTDHDGRDGAEYRNNDGYAMHEIGVSYNFGKAAKTCCNKVDTTARIIYISQTHDRDSDGVVDQLDLCPDIAGAVYARGCPDHDNDGVPDTLDKCPDVYGSIAAGGCPDLDGDGVVDSLDKCPDVRGVVYLKGCPDSDGDSIPDMEDQCPYLKGSIQTKGCPDTDGDGLHDGIDKCPTIPGVPANGGCPEIKAEVKQLFKKALLGIQFETGKAIIKPTSYSILDAIADVMIDNPTYKLNIGGHTDNAGNQMANMTLSQNRADAVAEYIIRKGVSPIRLSATGYGPTRPVSSNKTASGRARNRRVEFNVEFLQ